MPEVQLYLLPPGERRTPVLLPYRFPWMLGYDPKLNNARMLYKNDVLYLAMLHGKRYPDDLTGLDLDRMAAWGVLVGEQAEPFECEPHVPRERVEMLGRLLLSAFAPNVGVRVCRTYGGPDVLRVHVTPPGVCLAIREETWEEYAYRLPALRDLIVRAVKRRSAAR